MTWKGEGATRHAIVGSRSYPHEHHVREYVRALPKDTVVISGGAGGVDGWAIDEAKKCGLEFKEHIANWGLHGKAAGYIRNGVIVEDCDLLTAFWDGETKGTKNAISLAKKAKKLKEVIRSDQPQMKLL